MTILRLVSSSTSADLRAGDITGHFAEISNVSFMLYDSGSLFIIR